jgi:hypothetical protein
MSEGLATPIRQLWHYSLGKALVAPHVHVNVPLRPSNRNLPWNGFHHLEQHLEVHCQCIIYQKRTQKLYEGYGRQFLWAGGFNVCVHTQAQFATEVAFAHCHAWGMFPETLNNMQGLSGREGAFVFVIESSDIQIYAGICS